MTPRSGLDRLLTPFRLAFLAFVLALPSLTVSLAGDDYFHRMILLSRGELGAALDPSFDLFSFVPEDHRALMVAQGAVPWWSDPAMRIALARPITALTHRADYALWPDNFVLQHVHSLLWFGLGVALVACLYRRVHGLTATAGIAGLLFAVEDSHALPAGWLANRNALLCLVFGTVLIHGHIRWREEGKPSHLLAALLALTLGLGSGEAALGGLAYVAAWQFTEERRTWVARLLPLLPYATIVLIWRALYNRAGFGTMGSALYVDPGREPLAFLVQAPQRLPLLMVAQWLQAPIDLWLFLPGSLQRLAVLVATAATLGLAALLFDVARRERLARFWLLGMSLALVPVCAAFPMDRLLVFAGVGAFGAMALLFRDLGVWPWRAVTRPSWRRSAAILLLVLHVPVAAVLLIGRSAAFRQVGLLTARGSRESPAEPETRDQTFIYVNGNDFLVIYAWIIREAEASPFGPRRVAQLSSLFSTGVVYREDANTLVVRSRGGFLRYSVDQVMASATRRFHAGERIERPDYTVEIRAITEGGRPLEVAFRFRNTLEDRAYRWLYWSKLHVAEFTLPAVGQSVTLSGLID